MSIDLRGVVAVRAGEVAPEPLYPGVRLRELWRDGAARALLVEIDPGARFAELDVHAPGPEEVFVLSGTFGDGVHEHPAGTFLHHPAGTAHLPQSRDGCTLFVFYPAG